MSGSVAEMASSQADMWIGSTVWGMDCRGCGIKLSTWLGVSRDKAWRHLESCDKLKESLPEDHKGVAEAVRSAKRLLLMKQQCGAENIPNMKHGKLQYGYFCSSDTCDRSVVCFRDQT